MSDIDASVKTLELEKRTWHFIQQPSSFDVSPCACGNANTQWSEYQKHVWCEKCEIDFIPEHAGIFDGPIPTKLAAMLGIRFDRVNMITGKIEQFDIESSSYIESNVFLIHKK
jgi:hypothetical protein